MERVFNVAPPPADDVCLSQLPSQSQIWQSQQCWLPGQVNGIPTTNGQQRLESYLSSQQLPPEYDEDNVHPTQPHYVQPMCSQQVHRQQQQQQQSSVQKQQQQQQQQQPSQQDPRNNGSSANQDQRTSMGMLVPVSDIPNPYRSLFTQFPYFNIVQSIVFQDVFCSDRSVVVSAPTGSGKTVVMELAVVRLLQSRQQQNQDHDNTLLPTRVVYMAPMKALVTERYLDWRQRLTPLGLSCAEVTGDTDHDDLHVIRNSQLILTTPEKWDYLTRRWRDHASLMQAVSLLLIDEVHVLSDEGRGPTLEAVVSRMKTIRATRPTADSSTHTTPPLRFVAVSATIPNVEDVAAWLSDEHGPAVSHKLGENLRPVKLRRVVMGYNCRDSWSEFRFDLSLNYKLASVIATYSDNKPTLVFVSTRKGTQSTASTLSHEVRLVRDAGHRQLLTAVANGLRDNKLREVVMCGVGYHHAGVDMCDRRQVEELFVTGQLPVLISTSTLAMGVNLPAHLVVIKSTSQYVGGAYEEYSTAQLLQMTGRAGRPQFDTHATAVIMTKMQYKGKYESLVSGRSLIESHLHLHLVEHLNAEIVLGTVTDLAVAVEWLRSTFFYVRVQRNPCHYSLPPNLQQSQLEAKLQEMCTREVNALAQVGLITQSEVDVKPTPPGRLMARYCVSFTTMKSFLQLRGDESLRELIELVSECKEFWDVKVRVSEKRVLNDLNKSQTSSVRFPIKGKIKTRGQKINCLIQATLGSQNVVDPGLSQETAKVMRTGQRITKCLAEYGATRQEYELHLNTTLLAKCFSCRLWENSRFVTRQLERIGPALSSSLVSSKVTSFSTLESTTPRDIELILNRQPPFGNKIHDQAQKLPRYEMTLQQINKVNRDKCEVRVMVRLANQDQLLQGTTTPRHHSCRLIIGDADNTVVFHLRATDAALLVSGSLSRVVEVTRAQTGDELAINFISETWAGLDVQSSYTPRYGMKLPVPTTQSVISTSTDNTASTSLPAGVTEVAPLGQQRRACLHSCGDKRTCAHNCCKVGVTNRGEGGSMPAMVQEVKKRTSQLPATPIKKMKTAISSGTVNLSQFKFTPSRPMLLPAPSPMKYNPQANTTTTTTASNTHLHHDSSITFDLLPPTQGNQQNIGNMSYNEYMLPSETVQYGNTQATQNASRTATAYNNAHMINSEKGFVDGWNDDDFSSSNVDAYVSEVEKKLNSANGRAADQDYEDCFSEPLDIEYVHEQPQQQDLSSLSWRRFQARQKKNQWRSNHSNASLPTTNTTSIASTTTSETGNSSYGQSAAAYSAASHLLSGNKSTGNFSSSVIDTNLNSSVVSRASGTSCQSTGQQLSQNHLNQVTVRQVGVLTSNPAPSEAQYSQSQMTNRPLGAQNNLNPLMSQTPEAERTHLQTQVRPQWNQNQTSQRNERMHIDGSRMPVESQKFYCNDNQFTHVPNPEGAQIMMGVTPQNINNIHRQALIVTQGGQNWMPARYPGVQMWQRNTLPPRTSATLLPTQNQHLQTQLYGGLAPRPLQPSVSAPQGHMQGMLPLGSTITSNQENEYGMGPGDSFGPQSTVRQLLAQPVMRLPTQNNQRPMQPMYTARQLLPTKIPNTQNQATRIPNGNGNLNHNTVPSRIITTDASTSIYNGIREPVGQRIKSTVLRPQANLSKSAGVEGDHDPDSSRSYQEIQKTDSQYTSHTEGGGGEGEDSVVHESNMPQQTTMTGQDYKLTFNKRTILPIQPGSIKPMQQGGGRMCYSSDTVQGDSCSLLPSTSTSQAHQSILSTLQHSLPVAGVKPLIQEPAKSSGHKRGRKEDPFSHLTKEWTEAKKGKDRHKLGNISVVTPQPSSVISETLNTPKGDHGDDWRDLEIFQWCRQQEKNTLDSLYQRDRTPPRQYVTPTYRSASDLLPTLQSESTNAPPSHHEAEGSLHITYGSRNKRGEPMVGVDVTSVMGGQNINIKVSNIPTGHQEGASTKTQNNCTERHRLQPTTSDQTGVEPQVRGILKKPSQSAWSMPDIFEGIL